MNAASSRLVGLHRLYLACFFLLLVGPCALAPWWVPQQQCSLRAIAAAQAPRVALHACRQAFARDFAVGPGLWRRRIRAFWHLFGVSVVKEVEVGTEGWLHLYGGAFSEDRCIDKEAFGLGELQEWSRYFEQLQGSCAEQAIDFVLLIAPDKHTIYPQTLPWRLRRDGASRAAALSAHLRSHTKVAVIEPSAELRRHRHEADLYQRADTHWNGLGAYYAYVEVMHQLEKTLGRTRAAASFRPLERRQLQVDCTPLHLGDLESILQLERDVLFPWCTATVLRDEPLFRRPNFTDHLAWQRAQAGEASRDPRAFARVTAYTDSFGELPTNFLFGHVHEGIRVATKRVDADQLDYHRPQLLLYELVERRLYEAPPPPMEPPRGLLFGEGFFLDHAPSPATPRWMGRVGRAYVEHGKMEQHRQLCLLATLPPQLPADVALSLALDGAPAQPWPHDGHTATRCIAAQEWLGKRRWHSIDVTADRTFVPAQACGRADDVRALSSKLELIWQ